MHQKWTEIQSILQKKQTSFIEKVSLCLSLPPSPLILDWLSKSLIKRDQFKDQACLTTIASWDLFLHQLSLKSNRSITVPLVPIFTHWHLEQKSDLDDTHWSALVSRVSQTFDRLITQSPQWMIASADQMHALACASLESFLELPRQKQPLMAPLFIQIWNFYSSYQSRQSNLKKVRVVAHSLTP